MIHRRTLLGSSLGLVLTVPALAQGPGNYPDHPIKVTVGFALAVRPTR
ncbi:hypothetical protein ACFQU7_23880 [Pseudoroseomonas wenyumeiae]